MQKGHCLVHDLRTRIINETLEHIRAPYIEQGLLYYVETDKSIYNTVNASFTLLPV